MRGSVCHTYQSALSLCIPPEADSLHTHHTGSCDELEAAKILVCQRAFVCLREWEQPAAARQRVQAISRTWCRDPSLLSRIPTWDLKSRCNGRVFWMRSHKSTGLWIVFVLSSSFIKFMVIQFQWGKLLFKTDPHFLLNLLRAAKNPQYVAVYLIIFKTYMTKCAKQAVMCQWTVKKWEKTTLDFYTHSTFQSALKTPVEETSSLWCHERLSKPRRHLSKVRINSYRWV